MSSAEETQAATSSPAPYGAELVAFLTRVGAERGELLVLTHDHPDPDALASAWALAQLATHVGGVPARIAYGGEIGRAENRAMAELLQVPATRLTPDDLAAATYVAIVDTQPAFGNNGFPADRRADIIVDHHPRSADTSADLLILDHSIGATTTLLGEALEAAGIVPSRALATAMVYGIGSETQNLGRETVPRDAAVYMALLPRADTKALWRIANPRQPASYFRTVVRGLRDAFVVDHIIGVHLGELPHPDGVARMADMLLTHEGMRWALVTGRYQDLLHVSLRAMDARANAGKLMKRILADELRGGGHRMIAGGSLWLGADAGEETWAETEDGILDAFLRARGLTRPPVLDHPFR